MEMLLERLKKHSLTDRAACVRGTSGQELSYRELWDRSSALALYMTENRPADANDMAAVPCGSAASAVRKPVVVLGHKDVRMIEAFIACMKAGAAYCPVDLHMPIERINGIIEAVGPDFVMMPERGAEYPEGLDVRGAAVIGTAEFGRIEAACAADGPADNEPGPEHWLKEDEVVYMIFTSGSTGKPKGVQITLGSLENYLKWITGLDEIMVRAQEAGARQLTYINQAPFSFDLSVMDLYSSLFLGGRLWMLDSAVTADYALLTESLRASHADVWVSTPSFADMCLADRNFGREMMPELKVFLFCGEVLTNNTAETLLDRFDARVYNTYGPTEATVCVTSIEITREVLEKYSPLPIGKPKPGTWIDISPEDGEMIITGDTVSVGYFGNEEKTRERFGTLEKDGTVYRSYRSGDKGEYDELGNLFYKGRLDTQIKLHGFRIELEDIENNLTRLPYISKAVVLPQMKDGKIRSLKAKVILCDDEAKALKRIELSRKVKEDLKKLVPDYMVPKTVAAVGQMIMTANGKVDRKRMAED